MSVIVVLRQRSCCFRLGEVRLGQTRVVWVGLFLLSGGGVTSSHLARQSSFELPGTFDQFIFIADSICTIDDTVDFERCVTYSMSASHPIFLNLN